MKREDWITLYKLLSAGKRIQDVIYTDSRSIRDQDFIQLMVDRDTYITVKIVD